MKQYLINLKNIKTKEEFYERVAKGLKLPDWCGRNPDAIWDMLTGYIEHGAIIYVEGIEDVSQRLKTEAEILIEIFEKAQTLYKGIFKVGFIS